MVQKSAEDIVGLREAEGPWKYPLNEIKVVILFLTMNTLGFTNDSPYQSP